MVNEAVLYFGLEQLVDSRGQLKFLSHNFCYHNLIYFKLGITVGNVIMRVGSLLAFAKRAFLLNVTAVTERWHRGSR